MVEKERMHPEMEMSDWDWIVVRQCAVSGGFFASRNVRDSIQGNMFNPVLPAQVLFIDTY